jgi:glyoxylase-like metal-dependent hydrolase (beta-lactamase superfamily II)
MGEDFTVSKSTKVTTIADGDVIECGQYALEVVATPGHTPGSVVFVVKDKGTIFSGDTLFRRGVGRTDLPRGSVKELRRSIIERLFVFPRDYGVYPGHGGSTTIGEESRQ